MANSHHVERMTEPTTVTDLITALGGPVPVAAKAGVERNTVHYWQYRGRIPVEHWPALIEMGANQDALLRVCRPRKPRSDRNPQEAA